MKTLKNKAQSFGDTAKQTRSTTHIFLHLKPTGSSSDITAKQFQHTN